MAKEQAPVRGVPVTEQDARWVKEQRANLEVLIQESKGLVEAGVDVKNQLADLERAKKQLDGIWAAIIKPKIGKSLPADL